MCRALLEQDSDSDSVGANIPSTGLFRGKPLLCREKLLRGLKVKLKVTRVRCFQFFITNNVKVLQLY